MADKIKSIDRIIKLLKGLTLDDLRNLEVRNKLQELHILLGDVSSVLGKQKNFYSRKEKPIGWK